jgi:hypothetical protein
MCKRFVRFQARSLRTDRPKLGVIGLELAALEEVRILPDGRVALLQSVGESAPTFGVQMAQRPSSEPADRAIAWDQHALEFGQLDC